MAEAKKQGLENLFAKGCWRPKKTQYFRSAHPMFPVFSRRRHRNRKGAQTYSRRTSDSHSILAQGLCPQMSRDFDHFRQSKLRPILDDDSLDPLIPAIPLNSIDRRTDYNPFLRITVPHPPIHIWAVARIPGKREINHELQSVHRWLGPQGALPSYLRVSSKPLRNAGCGYQFRRRFLDVSGAGNRVHGSVARRKRCFSFAAPYDF